MILNKVVRWMSAQSCRRSVPLTLGLMLSSVGDIKVNGTISAGKKRV